MSVVAKVQRTDTGLSVEIPRDLAERLGLVEASEVWLAETSPKVVSIFASNSVLAQQVTAAEDMMDQYAEAFQELAR